MTEQFNFNVKSINDILKPSTVTIISGVAGAGKTTLALNIAAQFGLREGKTVAIFSLEMPKFQVVQKLICLYSGTSMNRILGGKLTPDEWKQLTSANEDLLKSNIVIDDSSKTTKEYVTGKCRRIIEKRDKLDVVIMDNMQNEFENVELIAGILNVPILVTANTNNFNKKDRISIIQTTKEDKQLQLTLNDNKKIILAYDFSVGRLSATE